MTKGAAQWQARPSCEIERVCRYITDDGFVASYYGITREEVRAIRLAMPKENRKGAPPKKQSKHSEEPIGGTQKWETDARQGSASLEQAIKDLFTRFGRQHGKTFEKAQELQLKGYRL